MLGNKQFTKIYILYVNCLVGRLSLFIFKHFFFFFFGFCFSLLFGLLCIFSMKIGIFFFSFSPLFRTHQFFFPLGEFEWTISRIPIKQPKNRFSWWKNVHFRILSYTPWFHRKKGRREKNLVDLISLDFGFRCIDISTISHCVCRVHAAVKEIVHFGVKTTKLNREKQRRRRKNARTTETKWRSHSNKNLGNWTVRRHNKDPAPWLRSQERASGRVREKERKKEKKSNRETRGDKYNVKLWKTNVD